MNQQKKRVKLAAGKAGRPKKLTPEQLRRGVEAYFASISYLEPVEIEEPVILETDPETGAITYQRDDYGHIMFRRRPVTDAGGKQLMRLKYIEPPGDFGLCNFLKISRDTWERYGSAVERLLEVHAGNIRQERELDRQPPTWSAEITVPEDVRRKLLGEEDDDGDD